MKTKWNASSQKQREIALSEIEQQGLAVGLHGQIDGK